jgi:hypothetical protein
MCSIEVEVEDSPALLGPNEELDRFRATREPFVLSNNIALPFTPQLMGNVCSSDGIDPVLFRRRGHFIAGRF